jgi:hypothetical protein
VAAGRIDTNANAAALAAIRARPVAEDDGSADWGRALVFFEMIERALAGTSANQCLLEAAQTYLDELFTAIANDLVAETGMGVITQSDARQHVLTDERWRDALAFLEAL